MSLQTVQERQEVGVGRRQKGQEAGVQCPGVQEAGVQCPGVQEAGGERPAVLLPLPSEGDLSVNVSRPLLHRPHRLLDTGQLKRARRGSF